MEDDHVDRPGVQVRQRIELTGTNRSFGLIVLIINARSPKADASIKKDQTLLLVPHVVFRRPGGPCEEPIPDPIPNSAVKLLSANGTVSQDPGE